MNKTQINKIVDLNSVIIGFVLAASSIGATLVINKQAPCTVSDSVISIVKQQQDSISNYIKKLFEQNQVERVNLTEQTVAINTIPGDKGEIAKLVKRLQDSSTEVDKLREEKINLITSTEDTKDTLNKKIKQLEAEVEVLKAIPCEQDIKFNEIIPQKTPQTDLILPKINKTINPTITFTSDKQIEVVKCCEN